MMHAMNGCRSRDRLERFHGWMLRQCLCVAGVLGLALGVDSLQAQVGADLGVETPPQLNDAQMIFLERLTFGRFASRWQELSQEQYAVLRTRADTYEAGIKQKHTPHGLVVSFTSDSEDGSNLQEYAVVSESALWTGAYLASKAYRYAVLRDSEAIAEIRRILSAVERLVEVSGRPGFIPAFCASADDPKVPKSISIEEFPDWEGTSLRPEWVRGQGDHADWVWLNLPSRSNYQGLNFGLGVTYHFVRDSQVRSSITRIVEKILGRLEADDWRIDNGRDPATFVPPLMRTALLRSGVAVNPGRYQSHFQKSLAELNATGEMPLLSYGPYGESCMAVLNYFWIYMLENSRDSRLLSQDRLTKLWRKNLNHLNPLLAAFYLSAYEPLPNDMAAHAVVQAGLYLFPDPPRIRRPGLQGGAWESFATVEANGRVWSSVALPFLERPVAPFQWVQSPFKLPKATEAVLVHPGIDYVLLFWMGRDSGVIKSEELAGLETPPRGSGRRPR